MKLNDLKLKRNELSEELRSYAKVETITDEVRNRIDAIADEIKALDADIKRMELIEKANILEIERSNEIEKEEDKRSYLDRWVEALRNFSMNKSFDDEFRGQNGGLIIPEELRADPWLSSSNTDIINKTVGAPTVKTAGGLEWLRQWGFTFDEGLTGNYVLPSISSATVGYAGEGYDTSTAAILISDVVLAPRTLGAYFGVSRQFLNQTNDNLLAGMLQKIDFAMGEKIIEDLFTQIAADHPTRVSTINTSSLSFNNILNMDASITVSMQRPAYFMNKKTANYLKKLNIGSDGIKYALENGELNGIPVAIHPNIADNKIYLLDAVDGHIGFWGGRELIIDQYTAKKSGKIEYQVLQLNDNGFASPQSVVIADVSAGM